MNTGPCAALLERVGGDQEIFAELCEVFLDDAPKRLDAIRRGLDAGDAAAVRREAHAFRGEAAAFDATEVVTLARELELCAAAGDLGPSEPLWTALIGRSQTLIAAVRSGAAAR